jgi:hypothetical protein
LIKQIIKRKYVIIIPLVAVLISIFIVFIKKQPEKTITDFDIKNTEKEVLIFPNMNNLQKENLNFNPNDKYIFVVNKCENLFRDWSDIFDYFSANKSLIVKSKTIDSTGLEKLSSKIKSVPNVFNVANVQQLVDEYGDLIKSQCTFYKMDWRLILALIHQESLFNSNAMSRAGAFGLMQIMPGTGLGLQNELNLEDTKAPQNNLTAGIYYYATLVANFEFAGDDKYKFALAAYNAGFGRVIDAMTITYYFGKDYRLWDYVKEYYPYLASKEDSVHALVWPNTRRPPSGALNNWMEPYKYVENVIFYYSEYKKYYANNLPEPKTKANKKKKLKKK